LRNARRALAWRERPQRRGKAALRRWAFAPPPPPRRPSPRAESTGENALVTTVVARSVHHPRDAVRVRARRQFARGGENEARALADRVDAAAHLGLDLGLGGALEYGHVDVADGHHAALVAERHQLVELIHLQRRIALLIEVDGDGDEAHVDQVLLDLLRPPAHV